ncbi:hypothetical protein ACFL5K_03535 [Gemmatimonadota bacterium]
MYSKRSFLLPISIFISLLCFSLIYASPTKSNRLKGAEILIGYCPNIWQQKKPADRIVEKLKYLGATVGRSKHGCSDDSPPVRFVYVCYYESSKKSHRDIAEIIAQSIEEFVGETEIRKSKGKGAHQAGRPGSEWPYYIGFHY